MQSAVYPSDLSRILAASGRGRKTEIRITLSAVSLTLNSTTGLYEYSVNDSRITGAMYPLLSPGILTNTQAALDAETGDGVLTLSSASALASGTTMSGIIVLIPTTT